MQPHFYLFIYYFHIERVMICLVSDLHSYCTLEKYRLVSKGCKLVGSGSAVPALSVSNDDLAKIVDTNDEWISIRTGIRNRRVITGQNM